jgi:hypothetical protein
VGDVGTMGEFSISDWNGEWRGDGMRMKADYGDCSPKMRPPII